MDTTSVLVIDDSALVRETLRTILNEDPRLTVVDVARDPYEARAKIKALNPDVLTLDVEMPGMDGIQFLRNLMRLRPMPVVMVSSLTERGADVTMEALRLGAVDFVSKPKLDVAHGLQTFSDEIISKVLYAAGAKISRTAPETPASVAPPQRTFNFRTTEQLIAIGASTGGTEAIRIVLEEFPPNAPGVVIAQHIPPVFSTSFAQRMDQVCAVSVCEAEDGQSILPGHVYIAPGDRHLRVVKDGARFACVVDDTDPVNRHRPSVDVLFDSVAKHAGRNVVAALLTGMGADGAQGLLTLREAGAVTIAQDERTSVVWGMPGQAVKKGAAMEVLPLGEVAQRILTLAEGEPGAERRILAAG